jgi:hypothetical protein
VTSIADDATTASGFAGVGRLSRNVSAALRPRRPAPTAAQSASQQGRRRPIIRSARRERAVRRSAVLAKWARATSECELAGQKTMSHVRRSKDGPAQRKDGCSLKAEPFAKIAPCRAALVFKAQTRMTNRPQSQASSSSTIFDSNFFLSSAWVSAGTGEYLSNSIENSALPWVIDRRSVA